MADNTNLIAAPYTPPRPERGRVYDAMRYKWAMVGGYHLTAFGPWPASDVAEQYGCWRVTGSADPTPGGELRYHAVCVVCGAKRTTTANKLRRSEGVTKCSACPK